jgi:hypothetical protein
MGVNHSPSGGLGMKYALVVYDKPGVLDALPEAERNAAYGEFMVLTADARFRAGEQLQPVRTARSVLVEDGVTQSADGPAVRSDVELSGLRLRRR